MYITAEIENVNLLILVECMKASQELYSIPLAPSINFLRASDERGSLLKI